MRILPIATIVTMHLAGYATRAWAQETPMLDAGTEEHGWRDNTRQTASAGGFLPLSMAPGIPHAGLAVGVGGYDGARGSAVMESAVEVRIFGPLAVRAGASYSDTKDRLRPSVGARLQLLSQDRHGLDGGIGVFYKPEGLTEPEGEIETVVALGRRMGDTYLVANLAYGQDPEANERDGEVRLAALHRIGGRLNAGLDGRWRFDLGSNVAKLQAAQEPTFDLDVGPVISLGVGPLALLAHAGASVVRYARAGSASVGAIAVGGLGSAF